MDKVKILVKSPAAFIIIVLMLLLVLLFSVRATKAKKHFNSEHIGIDDSAKVELAIT